MGETARGPRCVNAESWVHAAGSDLGRVRLWLRPTAHAAFCDGEAPPPPPLPHLAHAHRHDAPLLWARSTAAHERHGGLWTRGTFMSSPLSFPFLIPQILFVPNQRHPYPTHPTHHHRDTHRDVFHHHITQQSWSQRARWSCPRGSRPRAPEACHQA